MSASSPRPLYPIFLKLDGKPVLVVGGGRVAEEKIAPLLEAGAAVSVVSPQITDRISQWRDEAALRVQLRKYQRDDLASCTLVIAATNSPDVNLLIRQDAEAADIWVNAVDDPDNCSFYVPARVVRGRLQLAISTQGVAPTLAGRLRRQLEEVFPPAYAQYMEVLAPLRPLIKEKFATYETRMKAWIAVLDSNVFEVLRDQGVAAARTRAREVVGTLSTKP